MTDELLDSLVVPPAFSRYDGISDVGIVSGLQGWQTKLVPTLSRLSPSSLPTTEQAKLVRVLAPLTAQDAPWTNAKSRTLANALLAAITPTPALVKDILDNGVKPLFSATPHPRLHTGTARVLAHPADSQDPFHHQPWKDHPGLDEVIRWCILNTQPSAYDQTWPLILPPIMTFLDDYEVPYKIRGVHLVSKMLTRVPPNLLLRTGVDGLLFTSLINALNHLRDPSTPELIRAVVPTTIQLIDLTTPSQFSDAISLCPRPPLSTERLESKDLTFSLSPSIKKTLFIRFTRLSTLLSSSILGTIIMYTPTIVPPDSATAPDPFSDPEHVESDSESFTVKSMQTTAPEKNAPHPTLVAAAHVLPLVIASLGIGATRFLKGIVPVVTGWLALPIPTPPSSSSVTGDGIGIATEVPDKVMPLQASRGGLLDLHLAALHIIHVLLDTCVPRIEHWATTIVDGLARCWVGCVDVTNAGVPLPDVKALQKALQETAVELSDKFPSIVKNEFRQLLDFNSTLFGGLINS
ncbi:hypothetical protein J3A83DRAFT_4369827 [Scleroderma citrinum]